MILGVDYDTNQISIVGVEGGMYGASIKLSVDGKLWWDRAVPLGKKFDEFLSNITEFGVVEYVYVEESLYHFNPKTTIALSFILGIICFCCDTHNFKVKLVKNTVWKKKVLKNGRADKPEIKEKAIKLLGLADDKHQDFYDAACIALYGDMERSE